MKRTTITLLFLALLVSACGTDADSDATTSTTTTPPGDPGPTRVLLQIKNEGGFAPVEFVINRPPTHTLLTDGTLIFEGPQPGAFPGPIMPGMQQVKLTADEMRDIQVLIDATGLPTIDEVINNDAANFVADATSTVATYTDNGGGTHILSVYALGLEENPSDDLANLSLLVEKLSRFSFSGSAAVPYQSDSLIIRIVQGGGFGAEFNDTRPWDFTFEPHVDDANQFPCLIVEGADATAVRGLLADATQATQWEHASGTFSVLARDLLPGEDGCDTQ